MTDQALVKREDKMSIEEVKGDVNLIQKVMREVMRKDEHYGVIPGCGTKPTLLKPGAEKLCVTFRLSPTYDIRKTELDRDHREYEIVCTLTHIPTGDVFGQGVGSCSTMESKYRYRDARRKCPQCNAEAIIKGKQEFGGGWLCFAKKGGCGAKFDDNDPAIVDQDQGKVEAPDPADQYNTVLKMAKKRAHVDAVLTVTAASDIFTQDVEDGNGPAPTPEAPPKKAPPPKPDTDALFDAMVVTMGVDATAVDAFIDDTVASSGQTLIAVKKQAIQHQERFQASYATWLADQDEAPPPEDRSTMAEDMELDGI